ncbi:MAG: hypothetical protein R3F44_12405 [Candidatus Competibacteraceae bacterium]
MRVNSARLLAQPVRISYRIEPTHVDHWSPPSAPTFIIWQYSLHGMGKLIVFIEGDGVFAQRKWLDFDFVLMLPVSALRSSDP